MSSIPNPYECIPTNILAQYDRLRERIEAGDLITYEEAEACTNAMLWADAWKGHDRIEERGEGYYAADCREQD